MVQQIPQITLKQFSEHRIRRNIVGSILDEQADMLLSEPVMPQISQWLSNNDNLAFNPAPVHSSFDLSADAKWISISYTMMTMTKSDAVQVLYGN